MQCQRGKNARQIHDTSRGRCAQQRQECLGHRDHTKHIGLEGPLPDIERLRRHRLGRIVEQHTGIVDQNIERLVLAGDLAGGLGILGAEVTSMTSASAFRPSLRSCAAAASPALASRAPISTWIPSCPN